MESKAIQEFLEQHTVNWLASNAPPPQRVFVSDLMMKIVNDDDDG